MRGKEECTPVRQQGIRGCLHANGSFEGHTPQSCKGTGSAQKGLFNRRTHLREAGVSRRSSLFRPTSIFASTAPLRLATGINPPPSLGGKFCTSQGACPEGGPRFRRQRTKKKTYMISVLHDWQSSNLYQHTRWEDKEQTTLETQQILKLTKT